MMYFVPFSRSFILGIELGLRLILIVSFFINLEKIFEKSKKCNSFVNFRTILRLGIVCFWNSWTNLNFKLYLLKYDFENWITV